MKLIALFFREKNLKKTIYRSKVNGVLDHLCGLNLKLAVEECRNISINLL